MPNMIHLRGDFERYEGLVAAGQTVEPGMLVKVDANGVAGNNLAETCEKAFAQENSLAGGGIGTSYAEGSLCQYNVEQSGNLVQAWVISNATETLAVGQKLIPTTTAGVLGKGTTAGLVVGVIAEPVAVVENVVKRAVVRIV